MFNSHFNRVLAIMTWLLCLSGVVAVAFAGGNAAIQYLPAIALIAWLAWGWLWRPCLFWDDDAITVVNGVATTVIPWAAPIQVETRYALTLITPQGRYPVTVAPAPGRLATALSKRDMKGISAPVGSDGSVQTGDLPSSDSGAAAHLVRQRWQSLLDEGRIAVGTADSVRIDRQLHWVAISVSVVLAIVSVAALALI